MKNRQKFIFLILFFCFFAAGASFAAAGDDIVVAPVITGAEFGSSKNKPIIKGFAPDRTIVHIYFDGVYNGKTNVFISDSGIKSFSYEPFLDLDPGAHTVWAIAEDDGGRKSKVSNVFKFNIEPDVPAPTLFQPKTNENNINRPIIVGLSKGDLTIKMFIDGQPDGEFKVGENNSDTVSFSYQISEDLSSGRHAAFAIAEDNRGRESKSSNIISFKIADPIIAANKNKNSIASSSVMEIADNSLAPAASEEINEPIQENSDEKNEEAEKEKEQNKWPANLVVFVLFFAGAISWIIWANRGLIKEKKARAEKNIKKE